MVAPSKSPGKRQRTPPTLQYRLSVNEEAPIEADAPAPTEEAIDAFRKAAWLEPKEADFHFILGDALLRARRAAEAAVAFEEAAWVDPSNGQYQMALGSALRTAARIGEAVSAFREAVRLLPGDGRARNGLGVCLMEMGQAGEGMRQLARGAEEAPDSADLHLNLGLALVATGSAEEAVAPFERAAELAPTDPEPRAQLAAALHALGREAEALGAFQETLALAPRHLEQRPDLKAAYEASSLVDLRSRLRDELALPRARSRWLSSPLGFLLEALPTVPRRVGALMTVAALTLAASTSIGLARIYLHATAFREDVARIARSPVRDDSEILNRLMAVVDRHHLAGSIQPEQFVIESQRSFRRITCEYSVPFAAWLGARGRVPLRVDVDSPVLVPDEEVEIH